MKLSVQQKNHLYQIVFNKLQEFREICLPSERMAASGSLDCIRNSIASDICFAVTDIIENKKEDPIFYDI